ncbi:hypothetical protein [Parasphingorhabdus sp.]
MIDVAGGCHSATERLQGKLETMAEPFNRYFSTRLQRLLHLNKTGISI